jgi:hypothetical protein
MRLAADVNIIGGGRPDFHVASVSVELDSVTRASVSMLIARRGAKKFFVVTVDVGRAAFFEVQASSPVRCLFRLRTSLKPSSCFVCPA